MSWGIRSAPEWESSSGIGRIARWFYIAEPTLAFYVLAGSADRRDEACRVLQRIATRHTPRVASHRTVATAG
jgi:hypothetical protein